MVDLIDITWPDGADNTSGIQQTIYFAKLADIQTLPVPVVDDSTGSGSLAYLVTITDNILMKPYKRFQEMYVTLEKGALRNNFQGEMDSKSLVNELEFWHPGTRAEALGFAQWCKNSSLIFLVPEADGQVRLFGHRGYPAKLDSGEGGTGMASEDPKGMNFVFRTVRKGPAPIFTGKIDLTGSGYESGESGDFQELIYTT